MVVFTVFSLVLASIWPIDHAAIASFDSALERFLADWSAKLGEVKTLEITFRQEKKLRILRQPLASRGRIRMCEGRLLIETRDDKGGLESALLVEKDSLRLHLPRHKRLEVYDGAARGQAGGALPLLGSDPQALRRDFELALSDLPASEDGKKRHRLDLKPRAERTPVASIAFIFEDLELKEVEQVERSGDRSHLWFETFLRNASLRPEELRLEIPEGTREVRPLSPKEP